MIKPAHALVLAEENEPPFRRIMSKSIMVFNDNLEIQGLFTDILTQAGYDVSVHGYGTLDLEDVAARQPNLVIADCAPLAGEKEGWQFVQTLRMSRETEKIPVVICSTSLDLIHELEGWLKGKGVMAIPKPFTPDELLDAVERQIGKAKASGGSDG